MSRDNEYQTYIIPPNFLTTGRIFGGMIRMRNAVEAGILVVLTTVPIFKLPLSLTMRIAIWCLLPLPLGILGVIGIDGDSISEFLFNWFRWLTNRRVLHRKEAEKNVDESLKKKKRKKGKEKAPEERKRRAETCCEDIIPIKDIRNGIVEMKDGRYVKILEVEPINFLLRSPREQYNIIYNFASWMKIAPVKVQIKVLSKRADIGKHLHAILEDMEREQDPRCRALQEDYYRLIQRIGLREAVTRRFLLVMEYEGLGNRTPEYPEIVASLETAATTAKQYFDHCENEIVIHEDENAFLLEVLYTIFNRTASEQITVDQRLTAECAKWQKEKGESETIPVANVLAPECVDFTHGSFIVVDGLYYAYLMIPSDGYNPRVVAGWTSLLVNAGEGIDVDFYFQKEPKDRIQQKLGQQIRINRSRMKDASDTNTDYDDLDEAIRAGYYLKQGLSNYEDFYYASILVTVTADSQENLEWRVAEIKRLMISQDMTLKVCHFRQEDAMISAYPFCKLDQRIYRKAKRNMLTSAASSFYPFTAFEMSDENGILLGVNKHNNSLVIVDIFNSRIYKNANMAILGTSGAGKTFTMQLMALRMRRKGTQIMILTPLKGHEFRRACTNVGGEFISICPGSKQCINVLEIRKIDRSVNEIIDGTRDESSILARKIQQVHIFFSLLIPDMTHEERQLLDEVLVRAYEKKGITHDNGSLNDPDNPDVYREMPVLGDVYELLMEASETRRMGHILNRLVNGSAKTFNQQTNVNLNNPYTVLDISELSGDLLPVGMFVALDFMWDSAKQDRTKAKAIFVDEAWQLIGASSNTLAAEFVLEIFKVIRGYGGAAIAATQDLNDFFALDNGKYGRGIINNAKTKIILGLEDDEALRVQDTLHLSDAEVMSIVRFERGNGLISTNSNHVTVEFKASDLEKELITTDRQELSKLVAARTGNVH